MTPSDNPPAREVETADERTEPGPFGKLVEQEWQTLLDKDDRTSPEEYPEMCLITRVELAGAMSEAFFAGTDAARSPQPSRPQGEGGWRPIEALPNDETLVLGYSAGGHMMVWKARTLKRNTAGPTPAHLNFQATHWKPLPAPPAALSNQGKPSS